MQLLLLRLHLIFLLAELLNLRNLICKLLAQNAVVALDCACVGEEIKEQLIFFVCSLFSYFFFVVVVVVTLSLMLASRSSFKIFSYLKLGSSFRIYSPFPFFFFWESANNAPVPNAENLAISINLNLLCCFLHKEREISFSVFGCF